MAVTRLQRKARKNKTRAAQRKATMKRSLATPVMKKVDVEAVKKEPTFNKKSANAAAV